MGRSSVMGNNSTVLKSNKTIVSGIQGMPLVYGDLSLYSNEFKVAVDLFYNKSIAEAMHYFQLAYESVNRHDIYHNKYASYCGLVRLLNGDRGGLELCREVALNEKCDGDVFLNLARAEWHFQNRKKTIEALHKGRQIDALHPGILKMREELGIRKNKVLPGLTRNHTLNCFLGKLRREKAD